MRRWTPTLVLTASLAACAPAHRAGPTKPIAPPAKPAVAVPAPVVTESKPAHDYLHFAKDGKCADKLVLAYAAEAKARRPLEKRLARNTRALDEAKRDRAARLELWREPVLAQYRELAALAEPFNAKYGRFACPKRQGGEVLSSDAMNASLDAFTAYVKTEFGL